MPRWARRRSRVPGDRSARAPRPHAAAARPRARSRLCARATTRAAAPSSKACASLRVRSLVLPARSARVGEKRQGSKHVVQHAEVGQQVELLEDVADVVGAQAVASAGRELTPVLAEQADLARLRHQNAGGQRQQACSCRSRCRRAAARVRRAAGAGARCPACRRRRAASETARRRASRRRVRTGGVAHRTSWTLRAGRLSVALA